MATPADAPPPSLPVHVTEPILAICVHLTAASSLWQLAAISQPLLVLARTHVPVVTKAALMNLPQVDLTWATERGDVALLNLILQWSKRPDGRPLNYDPAAIGNALPE